MPKGFIFTLALLLFIGADIPGSERLRPALTPTVAFPSVADDVGSGAQDQKQSLPQEKSNAATLQERTKLDLIRYVSGEFAKATRNLPAGKDGYLHNAGKPLNAELLERAVATHGAAVHIGDNAQITKLEFHDKAIVVDVNGGGRGKKRWRDRIQIGMSGGGIPTARTTTTTPEQESGPPGMQPGMGSTITLQFDRPVPDLTPDELKQLLAPFLDFAKQRSAAVQWFETLPPEMKKAIQDRKPLVGMDKEEVVAAIGKPEHKVRERDLDGNEIEDWIYGQPPSKTMFVRFMGDHVTSIKQYPK